MPRRVYRVCRAVHAQLDGVGASDVGGRWNSPGRLVVYMAESISLAVLENLVHMSKVDFPNSYVVVAADLPDSMTILTEDIFGEQATNRDLRALGDRWIDSLASAVLQVRSAVVRVEHNYLLNPAHPDFHHIIVQPPEPFQFDTRLFAE